MKYLRDKLPKVNINFYKVVVGVVFSLLWARVMYFIWSNPSYVIFVWFYLGIGSMVLKWVIFEIIDRINLRVSVRNLERELDEAERRRREVETRGQD
jgi:hypothetical protein